MLPQPPRSPLFPTRRSSDLFWVVAREGSVSRAAKQLRVTQPTVSEQIHALEDNLDEKLLRREGRRDRKSTRLNSSHVEISYAVFCLKKKKNQPRHKRHITTK